MHTLECALVLTSLFYRLQLVVFWAACNDEPTQSIVGAILEYQCKLHFYSHVY